VRHLRGMDLTLGEAITRLFASSVCNVPDGLITRPDDYAIPDVGRASAVVGASSSSTGYSERRGFLSHQG
jgi:hypothetical protein